MIGDLISAASKLIGGYMSGNEQENANATNQANWQTSMAYQDLVNKNTIQWKVQDAQKAGLHPLAALGVNTAGGPTSFIGATPSTGMGNAVSDMGQDLSRALRASETQQRRAESFDTAIRGLDIENKQLQNELLRSRIAVSRAGTPPATPSFEQRWALPGSGDTPSVKLEPVGVNPGEPGKPYMEPGTNPDTSYMRTKDGYAIYPSKAAQERMEDNFLAQTSWMYRNQILPTVDRKSEQPPGAPPPDGYEWRWNAVKGEYRPARRKWGIFKEWK